MMNTTDEVQHSDDSNAALLDIVNHQFTNTILPLTIIIGIESVIGIIGNILIITVYSKQYERSNFRLFIVFLAFNDLTSCITCIPAEVFTQLNWYKLTYSWLCKTKVYFFMLTSWNSASILLLFSFDRFRKVCFPMKFQIRPSLARRLCIGLTITSIIIVVPTTLGYASQTYALPTEHGPVNVTVCGKSDELPETVYDILFRFYIICILLMMTLITIFNMWTAKKILCGKRLLSSYNTIKTDVRRASRSSSIDATNTVSESMSTPEENTVGSSDTTCTSDVILSGPNRCQDEDAKESKGQGNEAYEHDSGSHDDQHHLSVRKNQQANEVRPRLSLDSTPSNSTIQSDTVKKVRSGNGKRTNKLVIMFVLTMVFVVTMAMHVIVTFFVTPQLSDNSLSDSEKGLVFAAWRMFFINYIVNPFLYGFMDQRFRMGLRSVLCGR